jgi:hypothetical protein
MGFLLHIWLTEQLHFNLSPRGFCTGNGRLLPGVFINLIQDELQQHPARQLHEGWLFPVYWQYELRGQSKQLESLPIVRSTIRVPERIGRQL